MCLIKTHIFPKISSDPIKAYKVLKKDKEGYRTPIRLYSCNIGDTIKSELFWFVGILMETITGEGVHAYMTFADAKYHKMERTDIIVEVEIPPFTPYWIGDDDDIAASRMKLIRVL